MNKTSICKRLIATVFFCAVIFSACSMGGGAVQKKIIVIGIPTMYNGRYAVVFLYPSSDPVAAGSAVISNGKVNISLLNWSNDSPYTGTGNNYLAVLSIMDSSITTDYFRGFSSLSITDETTAMSFGEFIYFDISMRQSPFSVRDGLPRIMKELTE